ncbi:hypothetical protein [Bradyrhizobium sp. CCBAU 51753]|uniref:hypothetical protein n=1 Tax=Bradyrhizobium sp. CCBAU 51753 TaxID=1325100 RepID=UPI00188A8B2C|nr:hypothetical protein [Bradyrhizobium sp. CCBAU 51753]QOZ25289.1 hypothetical protein XH93_18095 [Bradyrhizobium sp. CCBAU 51753]
MTTTRRTLLAVMGLAPVSAVQAETFSAPATDGRAQTVQGAYSKERYACAFEQLAAELRRDAVELVRINFASRLESNSLADVHTMTVELIYLPEA